MPAIKIEGLAALSRDLKKVSADLPKKLQAVSKDAAEIVATEGRILAPKRSGRLAGMIKAGATAKGADVRINGLVYAGPVHFGWRKHNIEPNPFLYDALDKRRDEVFDKFEDGLSAFIDRSFD